MLAHGVILSLRLGWFALGQKVDRFFCCCYIIGYFVALRLI